MIVETMSAKEVDQEYERDCLTLDPIIARKKQYLAKAIKRSGKQNYQTSSIYKVNQNQYVVNYLATKGDQTLDFVWHYVSNTRQPYFMASMLNHETNEGYYHKIDAHAILRFMERTPDYVPTDKDAFVKEAVAVTMDLIFPVMVDANYVTPKGLWPLATKDPVNGFLHVKTFIHKSMLNNRQRELYKEGLKGVEEVALPLYIQSYLDFGLVNSDFTEIYFD